MKKIPIRELEANTYYSSPVWLDDNYILLAQSIPLSNSLLKRLRQWGFAHILTEGSLVQDPPALTSISQEGAPLSLHQNLKEKEKIQEAAAVFNELLSFTEKTFTDFVTKNTLSIQALGDTVKDLIDQLRSSWNYLLRLTDFQSGEKNYIVVHSVKTAILSLAIGIGLKIPVHKLIELGIAALLHEIGMIRLPPQLYMSARVLTAEEKRAISAHSVLGFKILKSFSFPIPVCTTVLNHREHPDGSGYPRGLKGESISQAALIIGAASSYAALISPRPFRPAMAPHAVLMALLKDRGRRYDETILKALVYSISIYPLGSYVLLVNGAMGVVVETNRENPKAPKVKVCVQGKDRLKDPILIKSDEGENRILRPLSEEEWRENVPGLEED